MNDVYLVTYLASLTKVTASMGDVVEKFRASDDARTSHGAPSSGFSFSAAGGGGSSMRTQSGGRTSRLF